MRMFQCLENCGAIVHRRGRRCRKCNIRVNFPNANQPKHPCAGNCGKMTQKKGTRCRACWKELHGLPKNLVSVLIDGKTRWLCTVCRAPRKNPRGLCRKCWRQTAVKDGPKVAAKFDCAAGCGRHVWKRDQTCRGCHKKILSEQPKKTRTRSPKCACPSCGKAVWRSNHTCIDCKKKARGPTTYPCLTCGKQISVKAYQCRDCKARDDPNRPWIAGDHRKRGWYCNAGCGTLITHEGKCAACYQGARHENRKVGQCIDCRVDIGKDSVRCLTCNNRFRTRPTPKKAPVKVKPIVAREVKMYPCMGNCDTQLSKENKYCLPCRQANQQLRAAKSDYQKRFKVAYSALGKGKVRALMEYGTEVYVLACECQNPFCKKPILQQGLCYECATGQGYTIRIRPRIIFPSPVESEKEPAA